MERPELQTYPRTYHSCVIWHIDNYFKTIVPLNTAIESPEFVTNLRQRIKWKLSFLARREDDGNYVTEFILRRSPSCNAPDDIEVKLDLSMIDSRGNVLGDSNIYRCFFRGQAVAISTWDIYDIRRNEAESTCFFTGNIRIICSIIQEKPHHHKLIDIDDDLWYLSSDLQHFYEIGHFTDLNLKVDEKTFSVHSLIVKVRSPKVREMLNDNPSQREIDLTDFCSVPMMEGLIEYWYSSGLEKLQKKPTFSAAALIRNMEQLELRPYFDPEYIKLNTIFKTSNRSISWVIKDIHFCGNLRHLKRGKCHVYKCEDLPWKLHIYPNGIRRDANCFTMIIIQNGRFNTTHLELFLKDENDKEYFCTHKTVQNVNARIHTFCKFVTHIEFASFSELLLKGNTLRIGCRMVFSTGYAEQNSGKFCFTEECPLNRKDTYINFANDMKRILGDEDSSDVSLKSGDKIFKVHSTILAARSSYFANLFRNPEYESGESNTITLDDVEPDDLDKILKYVYYAEKIVLNSDLALKLYPVFWSYGIWSLETLCTDYLQDNLSVANALHIADLADTFQKQYLKDIAEEYIVKNWDEIKETKTWNQLREIDENFASEVRRLVEINAD